MTIVAEALDRTRAVGLPVFWLGPCPEAALAKLEGLLGVPLPPTFREFLMTTGGGEIATSALSGIEKDDPLLEDAGTVWGDTLRCREDFSLPEHLVVIYFANDEICWCLDSSRKDPSGEYPVVTYSIFGRVVEKVIAPNFGLFLKEFVETRIAHS